MDTEPTSCSNLSFCFIAVISAPSLVLEASSSSLRCPPVLCHLYSRYFKTPIRPFHLEKLKSWIRSEPETYFWTSRTGAETSTHKDGDWLKSDSASKSQIRTSGNTTAHFKMWNHCCGPPKPYIARQVEKSSSSHACCLKQHHHVFFTVWKYQ